MKPAEPTAPTLTPREIDCFADTIRPALEQFHFLAEEPIDQMNSADALTTWNEVWPKVRAALQEQETE